MMLETFAILLLCQGLGELLRFWLDLSIPGPVLGMVLLFGLLRWRPALLTRMESTANALLQHLSILFVPAGVGIIGAFTLLRAHWLAVLVSLLVSTVLTLLVTALVARWVTDAGLRAKAESDHD